MNDTRISNHQDHGSPEPKPTGHSLVAVDRREITVRGAREVLSFDETHVRLVTTAGILELEGNDFRIHTLNTENGVIAVTGHLTGVLYEDDMGKPSEDDRSRTRRGLFGRRG